MIGIAGRRSWQGTGMAGLALLLALGRASVSALAAQSAPGTDAASPPVVPSKVAVSSGSGESDYPALCTDRDGSAWAVWQVYEQGADRLSVARWSGKAWSAPAPLPGLAGDLHGPECAVDGEGRLHLVWSQQVDADWDLWSASHDGRSWSPPARVSARAGTDFAPSVAAAPDGSLLLVWQAWRGDGFDVLLSSRDGDGWSAPEVVTDGPGNDWAPVVAVSPGGVASVAWDSYRHGNYDVFLRQRRWGRWDDEVVVAGSARFEGHARLAVDPEERVWIAYEERGERWGKDRGYVTTPGFDETNTLLGFTRARVKAFHQGRLLQPVQPAEQLPVHREWGGDRTPVLAVSPTGHLWMAFKRPDPEWMQLGSFKRRIPFAGWRQYASVFDGDRWSDPLVVDSMLGRPDSDLAIAALPDGRLLHLWHSDHRGGRWHNMPRRNRVFAAALAAPGTPAIAPRLAPAEAGSDLDARSASERERRHVARARAYAVDARGVRHRLFRGDLHRHTDMSWDGPSEGTIEDLFRYALDAAALDFVAVTDHSPPPGIEIEYVRWRTQKITDLFHAPPHFIPLFGYERSIKYPFGHRNVIEAETGYRPDGFVWEAWKKGYRLGVIASSDHQATHVAYANVLAPEGTREDLLEAMRARHTFASTDNIVLDFRTTGGHLQGDDVRASEPPAFHVRVLGTAPIREIVIMKDFEAVHTVAGGGEAAMLTWRDRDSRPGESQYYVRVLQENGELAWSSPIWVTLAR